MLDSRENQFFDFCLDPILMGLLARQSLDEFLWLDIESYPFVEDTISNFTSDTQETIKKLG